MTAEITIRPAFTEIEPYIPLKPNYEPLEPAQIISWSRALETDICDDPERYKRVLEALGDVATSGEAGRLLDLDLFPEDVEAAFLIYAFFAGRCDQDLEYDDATDRALRADADYQAALAAHGKATSKQVLVTKATHGTIADRNAEPNRDKIRRISLAFFIQRTLDWQAQELAQAS